MHKKQGRPKASVLEQKTHLRVSALTCLPSAGASLATPAAELGQGLAHSLAHAQNIYCGTGSTAITGEGRQGAGWSMIGLF